MKGDAVQAYASRLVAELEQANLHVRLFGGIGVALLVDYVQLFGTGREIKDIDLVARSEHFRRAWDYLQTLHWKPNRKELFAGYSPKAILWNDALSLQLDLYADPLVFNQRIVLGERLTLISPTITPVDLLLTKLQIHAVTERDLKDILGLLTLDVSSSRESCLNVSRIAEVCSADWGLWFACTSNLRMLANWIEVKMRQSPVLGHAQHSLAHIEKSIAEHPKTVGWKVRNLIGRRLGWYYETD